jgi:hypothetical protein
MWNSLCTYLSDPILGHRHKNNGYAVGVAVHMKSIRLKGVLLTLFKKNACDTNCRICAALNHSK